MHFRRLYLDALRSTNTTEGDEFLIEKIQTGEILNNEAISILGVWTVDKVPTRNVLDLMSVSVL